MSAGEERPAEVRAATAHLGDFLSTLPDADHHVTPGATGGPFLSFLLTTSGRAPESVDETLLSLTAQSDTDFEVLVMADADDVDDVRAMLAEHPPTLRERAVVVAASGHRADVLNAGLAAARGTYVALADDVTWFGHWVETARASAERSPGRCVRGIVVTQPVATVHVGGHPGTRATSAPSGGARPFSLAQHVVRPLAPTSGVAIPRAVVTDLGLVLDASFGSVAVRRHLVRAVELAGVVDTGEVVALHRRHEQDPGEADDDLALLVEAIDAHPWLAPSGAASAAVAAGVVEAERAHARALAQEALAHHVELVALKDTHIANLEHVVGEREAELERLRDQLAARVTQVERLRAKVARHKEGRRSSSDAADDREDDTGRRRPGDGSR